MSRVVFTPELVRELIDYDPETGVMTWRERRAQLYLDLVPGITMEAALSRAGRFNTTWAGREVGTDQVYKSVNRRVRISFGSGITAVRKNATTVAWMLGAPTLEVNRQVVLVTVVRADGQLAVDRGTFGPCRHALHRALDKCTLFLQVVVRYQEDQFIVHCPAHEDAFVSQPLDMILEYTCRASLCHVICDNAPVKTTQ